MKKISSPARLIASHADHASPVLRKPGMCRQQEIRGALSCLTDTLAQHHDRWLRGFHAVLHRSHGHRVGAENPPRETHTGLRWTPVHFASVAQIMSVTRVPDPRRGMRGVSQPTAPRMCPRQQCAVPRGVDNHTPARKPQCSSLSSNCSYAATSSRSSSSARSLGRTT